MGVHIATGAAAPTRSMIGDRFRPLLRVPLLGKLLGANAIIIVLAAVTIRLETAPESPQQLAVLTGALFLALAVNIALVWLALRPVHALDPQARGTREEPVREQDGVARERRILEVPSELGQAIVEHAQRSGEALVPAVDEQRVDAGRPQDDEIGSRSCRFLPRRSSGLLRGRELDEEESGEREELHGDLWGWTENVRTSARGTRGVMRQPGLPAAPLGRASGESPSSRTAGASGGARRGSTARRRGPPGTGR